MTDDLKVHERRIFWIALVLPPVVWFANLGVSYALAGSDACHEGRVWPIFLTMAIALVIAGGAAAFAYREWKRLGSPYRALDPADAGVAEFLAAGGRLLTVFFFVVTAAAILPPVIFEGCLP